MVKISVQSLREDYDRAKAENRENDISYTKGVHISSIFKDPVSGKESIRISKGAKDRSYHQTVVDVVFLTTWLQI